MKSGRWAEFAALVILGGCGSGGNSERSAASSAAEFVERDSAGIAISVTPGHTARAPLGWEVSTAPDLEIGATAGEPSGDHSQAASSEFYQIRGVRQLPDGRVVVLDGGSNEVRFFDSRGQFLQRTGGTGQGPGEFEAGPVLVPSLTTDSLLLFDARLARFHFLSFDGIGYRVLMPITRLTGRPVGLIAPHVFVEGGMVYKPTTTGPINQPMTYAWTHIHTGHRILVDSLTVRQEYVVIEEAAPPSLYPIPFSSRPAAAVTRNGALIAEGVHSEIKEYDIEGRLRRIIRIDEPPRSVTDADVRRYIESADRYTYHRDIEIPGTMPAFQSLLVDDEGWPWAQLYAWDPTQPPTWLVFEPDGRARGSISTPVGLDIHQVGSDFILGVWRDELGVEHVRRYRLERRPNGRMAT